MLARSVRLRVCRVFLFPEVPTGTLTGASLAAHITYCATSFVRHGFDFRTLLQPLFKGAVCARVSGELSRAVEFTYSPFVRTGLIEGAYGCSVGGVLEIMSNYEYFRPTKQTRKYKRRFPRESNNKLTSTPIFSTFCQAFCSGQDKWIGREAVLGLVSVAPTR